MRPAHLASMVSGLAGLGFLAGGVALRGLGPAGHVLQAIGVALLVLCVFWLALTRRRPASERPEQGGNPDGT